MVGHNPPIPLLCAANSLWCSLFPNARCWYNYFWLLLWLMGVYAIPHTTWYLHTLLCGKWLLASCGPLLPVHAATQTLTHLSYIHIGKTANTLSPLASWESKATIAKLQKAPLNGGKFIVTGLPYKDDWSGFFPLEVIHSLKRFHPIVAFVGDVAAARKHMTSRTARYSGLLGILQFRERKNSKEQEYTTNLIKQEGDVTAWLAFNPFLKDAGKIISAAEALKINRFVIAFTNITLNDETLKQLKLLQQRLTKALEKDIRGTIITTGKTKISSVIGEPIFIGEADFENSAILQEVYSLDNQVVNSDFIHIVIECFRVAEAEGKTLYVTKSNDTVTSYIKKIRSQGMSRAEELIALLKEQNQPKPFAPCKTMIDIKEASKGSKATPAKSALEKDEIDALFNKSAQIRLRKQQKIEEETALQLLSHQWRDQYTFNASEILSEDEYIKKHWKRGIEEAKETLR